MMNAKLIKRKVKCLKKSMREIIKTYKSINRFLSLHSYHAHTLDKTSVDINI